MAKIVKFRPRPIGDGSRVKRDEPCIIVVLPVVRIERVDGTPHRPGRARRRSR